MTIFVCASYNSISSHYHGNRTPDTCTHIIARSVPLYMLSNVFGGFKVRLEDCIKVAGAHIEHCRKKTCEDCNRH